jgi:acyl-CoA synthetase (AMP-forming)/AMP-acid ligase II
MAVEGVVEAVVFGIPHPDLGEEVMAIVVTDRDLTQQHLQQQLRATLASFSVPSLWRLQKEALPTNPAGKVDKPTLAAQARADIAQARTKAGA